MSFLTKEKSTKYHVERNEWLLANSVSDEQLEKWATDPDCIEKDKCAAYLADRLAKRQRVLIEQRAARAAKREELQDNPFDPRTEVSADAKHIAGRIVKNLWIIFVLLPVVLGILFAILTAK